VLGNNTHVVSDPAPLQPLLPPDLPGVADIGVRNFDEIDATMAELTGVSRKQVDVEAVFETVRQQLPAVENIEGFLAAHQMAVSQLAIEYCSALVDNRGQILRADYFPGFAFNDAADDAFNSAAQRDLLIVPLLERIMNTGVTTQPDPAEVTVELDNLILDLTACAMGPAPTCASTARTEQIVKATCAATLGSAVMLVQ
jgi:hypothetical protein